MNLRVDLILHSEQRSGRVLSARTMTRAATIAIPVIIALIMGGTAVKVRVMKKQVQRKESRWADLHPKQQAAEELQARIKANETRLAEIDLWNETRMGLAPLIEVLRQHVPASMQLTELHLTEEYAIDLSKKSRNKDPQRIYKLILAGRTEGANAKDNVEHLTRVLNDSPPFADLVVNAFVPPNAFRADESPDAPPSRRIFRIQCDFEPRAFKQGKQR